MIAVKNKQKTAHDKQMAKPKSFDIWQKVLYYEFAKMNQFLGKLEPKWKGPYRIHEVLINWSYKLREIDGWLLAKPVNGDLLKEYFDRQLWELMWWSTTISVFKKQEKYSMSVFLQFLKEIMDEIYNDIIQLEPIQVDLWPRPYNESDDASIKMKTIQRYYWRAKMMKKRIAMLVYMYFAEELLDEIDDSEYKRVKIIMSLH